MLVTVPGFNEMVLGGGVEVVRGKVAYTTLHRDLGYEREAGVELSRDLAIALAGQTYSVWRRELRVLGATSF